MPGWRPEDVDNGGTGVLIRYDLNEFELQRAGAVSPPVELAVARPSPARLHAGAMSAGEEAAVENQQITQLSVLTASARLDAGSPLPRMEALVRNVVAGGAPPFGSARALANEAPAEAAGSSVLDEYQLWPHGYVAAATLHASRRALLLLAERPLSLSALAEATAANEGHLGVALRTLCALEWVELGPDGRYALPSGTATVASANCWWSGWLEEACAELYCEGGADVLRLATLLGEMDASWSAPYDMWAPAGLRRLVAGAVLAPPMLLLQFKFFKDK